MKPQPSKCVRDGIRCPRCRSTDIDVLRTEGGFEYRQCQRAVCKTAFHVTAASLLTVPPSEPETPPAPARAATKAPTGEKTGRPLCPRCRRRDRVRIVEPGQWCCEAEWHGRLVFLADGKIVGGETPRTKGDRGIRTSY